MTFLHGVPDQRRLDDELGLQDRDYLAEALRPFEGKSIVGLTTAERKEILRRVEEPLFMNAYDEASRLLAECRHRLGLAEKKSAPTFINELSTSEFRIDGSVACARAQSEALRQAKQMGFEPEECKHIAISAGELGQSLLAQGKGGKFTVRFVYSNHGLGLELVTVDHGPGFSAETVSSIVSHSQRDAFGNLSGLAIVNKLAHHFSVRTREDRSNQVVCQFWVLA